MKIKLVVFDFDGTLVQMHSSSAWRMIDKSLGCEDADKEITQRHFSGETTVAEWSRETVETLYKNFGLDKNKFEEILRNGMQPMPGAVETLKKLKEMGITTAIVSGSISNVYDFAKGQWGLRADKTSFECDILFDAQGKIIGGRYNDYDFEGKVNAIETFCKELGVTLEETAMVGDSDNDVFAFRKVGLPIAFNAESEELKKAAKHVVTGKDLTIVLDLILV
jgi:HAD superfamily phosphoserine phosphatase-like hydrolase